MSFVLYCHRQDCILFWCLEIRLNTYFAVWRKNFPFTRILEHCRVLLVHLRKNICLNYYYYFQSYIFSWKTFFFPSVGTLDKIYVMMKLFLFLYTIHGGTCLLIRVSRLLLTMNFWIWNCCFDLFCELLSFYFCRTVFNADLRNSKF